MKITQAVPDILSHKLNLAKTISTFLPRQILAKHLSLGLLAVAGLTLCLHFLPEDDPFLAAAKLLGATLTVGVLPGTLLVLRFNPRPDLTLLEALGIGMATSLGLIQVLTIVSLVFHVSVLILAFVMLAGSVLGALLLSRQSDSDSILLVEKEELIIGLILIILSFFLYLKGSPYTEWEDQIHVSVARRLAVLSQPELNNIYLVPDFIYTYPFPGIHFFFALVSRLAEVDPLFVYHKLRFLWGSAAITFLYLAARLTFKTPLLACVTTLTALVFILNGSFADVTGFLWAQLIPVSHASDVAMGVLLPGLLMLSFYFFEAKDRRGNLFFFLTANSLILMITIVHIREIVQFLIYLGSFFLALILLHRDKTYLKKTALLMISTTVLVIAYTLWHKYAVGKVDLIVETRRAELLEVAKTTSWPDFFTSPFMDNRFVVASSAFFYGWFPLVLVASPFIFFIFRHRVLVLLIGMSILVYLLIIRFPILSIPYIYFTYYEILFTPVRNIVFFIYLLTGIFFYLLAVNLARLKNILVAATTAVAVALCLGSIFSLMSQIYKSEAELLVARSDWLFLPTILLFLLALGLGFGRGIEPAKASTLAASVIFKAQQWSNRIASEAPERSWRALFGLLVLPVAFLTMVPESSPLALNLANIHFTNDELVRSHECSSTSYSFCMPSYKLMKWARNILVTTDVMVTNKLNTAFATSLLPQQIIVWPGGDNYWARSNFPKYYQFYDRIQLKYNAPQPFFNSLESLNERLEFIQALHITHILVDPMYYKEMKTTLAQWPDNFGLLYDDGQWAVYEVKALEK